MPWHGSFHQSDIVSLVYPVSPANAVIHTSQLAHTCDKLGALKKQLGHLADEGQAVGQPSAPERQPPALGLRCQHHHQRDRLEDLG